MIPSGEPTEPLLLSLWFIFSRSRVASSSFSLFKFRSTTSISVLVSPNSGRRLPPKSAPNVAKANLHACQPVAHTMADGFVIISCIGAQTIQIYRLALDITHEWPVLVHTVARHGGPLQGGLLVFACIPAFCTHGGCRVCTHWCSLAMLVPPQYKYIILL